MTSLRWWQKGVFYQIYPRSFADSNGDGIGDIPGMTAKLDYLQKLGIDGIWLSPHYPSPMWDCGYDVADYIGVAAEYGTMDDFKHFLEEAHRRDIRVILDLVLNHTSDEHPWFLESRSSRDNPKRDWYIWRDGTPENPPNDWYSTFGGSAWEYDALTGQSYYHFFFKQQPDLNWRNPEVVKAMLDSMRFWYEMGVDGFRIDAIGTLFEDEALTPHGQPFGLVELRLMDREARTGKERRKVAKMWDRLFRYQHDLPGMHEIIQQMRDLTNEYEGRMLVGETDDIRYHGTKDDELHMVFNFPLMTTNHMTPQWARDNQKKRLSQLPAFAWPCNTLNNHDTGRAYSNMGDGINNDAIARVNLALMLTLRGTPFLYNGEEIGMSNLMLDHISQFKDTLGTWIYAAAMEYAGATPAQALEEAAKAGRDKGRTPMQWRRAPQAGFCPEGVQPWLPVNPDYLKGINVEDQDQDPASMLNFYRQMLAMRRRNPALIEGDYQPLLEKSRSVLAFWRRCPAQQCVVVLNMSAKKRTIDLGMAGQKFKRVFSSHERPAAGTMGKLRLEPYEIWIGEIIS
ncbi:MAG TPA: alpha-glucosidase [Anaerolineaceae bacterium]|nr:alpha-glucosidase [Anaerolineaceae bacterium]HPN50617.1 alpha-glucosidase [Anaerolineaceae bacterium]